METAQPVTRTNPLRSLMKGILFAFIKVVMAFMALWRRWPLPALIVLVMVVGSVFALTTGTMSLPGVAAPAAPEARLAVESYLAGQKNFDASMMWNAMDDQFKMALQSNGQTLQAMQQEQQKYKAEGIKVAHKHVADANLSDGRQVYLYVVTISKGTQSQEAPYMFTVSKAGKIVAID
jgi:hypothetical protein